MDSATEMVVEAGLSVVFKGLFDNLALPFFKDLGHLFGVKKEEVDKLSRTLRRIEALLIDAEERQIKDKSVRLWLSELKDVASDAEDILEELALQSKLETRKRKRTPLLGLFSRGSSNLDFGSRIRKIQERLDEIERENNKLHLKEICGFERLQPVRERPRTSSVVDESNEIGRDADIAKVIGLLLTSDDSHSSSSSAGRNGIGVVPICGMGGIGKTTLARLVYNNERVEEHFEVRGWISVSQDFDLSRLSKEILESLTGSSCKLKNLTTIRVRIKEALKEKRFLLVLDDVWNENCDDWDALRAPLMNGATGSRILVTTRSQRFSSIVGTVPTYSLQGLSDDDCWSLFERQAFVEGNSDARPKLKKIGKEIVNKCNGLPLAVKSLGGLLRYKVDAVEWEAILKSEIWSLPEERNEILPALRLSYHHLPAHLKRCFAYLCLFCKGTLLVGDRLVLMWMAQGYIEPKGSEPMEDIGREYLADLVSRSLLHASQDWKDRYIMHDLTHDLALSVSGDEFFMQLEERSCGNVEKARHVSYLGPTKSFNFADLYRSKTMRTLVLFALPKCIDNIPADLFINLRHIRVLEFGRICITELPESIGNLILLRHLDLSETLIKRLPKSTTRLYSLQTLLLDCCHHLVELPSDLTKLVNLKLLSLQGCSVSIPPGIGRFTTLKIIGGVFTVEKMSGYKINKLKDIKHLEGSLCISKLENVGDVQEAKEAELKKKLKIHSLKLEWKSDDIILRQEGIDD